MDHVIIHKDYQKKNSKHASIQFERLEITYQLKIDDQM